MRSDTLSKLFPRIQLGVGVSGGSEIAVHTINAALDTGRKTVVISTDI